MQDAPASCTWHAQKENKDLSIEPARRSHNANLKFYRNAFCIAYFKINPCIFILCTMKNIHTDPGTRGSLGIRVIRVH